MAAAVPDPALAPFGAAVRAGTTEGLLDIWRGAVFTEMDPALLKALVEVCAARKAQLLDQDAEAMRLVQDVLGGVRLPQPVREALSESVTR